MDSTSAFDTGLTLFGLFVLFAAHLQALLRGLELGAGIWRLWSAECLRNGSLGLHWEVDEEANRRNCGLIL
jgi:hypothetical protein